jgi:hypothetical protein
VVDIEQLRLDLLLADELAQIGDDLAGTPRLVVDLGADLSERSDVRLVAL